MLTLVALLASIVATSAQYDYLFDYVEPEPAQSALQGSESSSRGLLPSHRAIIHYPSREALDSGLPSDMVIELTNWQVEILDGERTRYTTRFKRNYKYDDRELILRIEGAVGAVSVEVNDEEVGYNASAAGRSEFDLSKVLKENNNTISITIHNNYAARCLEPKRQKHSNGSDFLSAQLITSPRVAVSDFVTSTTFNASGDGLLNLGVVMQSFLLNSKEYHIFYELHSPEGEVVASANKMLTTRMLSRDTVSFFARVPKVKKWSPEEPNLYKIVVYTKHEKRVKEFCSIDFGFRTAELKDGALALNGQAIDIKQIPCGFEQSTEQSAEKLRQLKKEGYNMVITPAPQPESFYTLCDSIGMLVCDQADIDCSGADNKTTPSNNPAWKQAYIDRALQMYHSSKNHPSVVMFSIARNAQNGICLYESYLAMKAIKGENRPIVYPEAGGQWNSDL